MILPAGFTSNSQEGRFTPTVVGQTFQSVPAGCLNLISLPLILFILSASFFAQDLPDKIRGYKVHSEKIVVSTVSSADAAADASVKIGDPTLVEAGLAGVTFELPAEVRSAKQSGKVDFLTFHDVRVNGVAVEVEEYRDPFDFRKGKPTALPKPARILIPVTGMLQAAWSEMRDSKAEWTVSGRVFVFGRFRRFGMYHKRVVPVEFEIRIKNPLKIS